MTRKFFIKVLKQSDSKKSCFCKVTCKVGVLRSEVGVGYLYVDEGDELPEIGTELPYEGEVGFQIMTNEDGEVRTTKEGVPLERIVLK